jgi:hypothetical protein
MYMKGEMHMDTDYRRYAYSGPVVNGFGQIVADKWAGETMATSPMKARANFAYRIKTELGLVASAKLVLPGKVTEVL